MYKCTMWITSLYDSPPTFRPLAFQVFAIYRNYVKRKNTQSTSELGSSQSQIKKTHTLSDYTNKHLVTRHLWCDASISAIGLPIYIYIWSDWSEHTSIHQFCINSYELELLCCVCVWCYFWVGWESEQQCTQLDAMPCYEHNVCLYSLGENHP